MNPARLRCIFILILKFSLGLAPCLVMRSVPAYGAIFGIDDRESITGAAVVFNEARATAIAVLSGNASVIDGKLKLDTDPVSSFVCKDQRFSDEPSLSYACTGFLVAPDLIATAGHCMVNAGESHHETDTYCKAFSWLFDYRVGEGLSKDQLYACKEVIYAVLDEKAPFRDYALVRLARPVIDREPLKLAPGRENSGPLSMIGYPLGMPEKLSKNAKILLNNQTRQSFITNLDAFEGNSGSPVFNRAMEVVGILVGGTPSPSMVDVLNEVGGSCEVYDVCDENGENCRYPDRTSASLPGFQRIGSEVQRIAPIEALIKNGT